MLFYMANDQVLIAGAGPTGLVLALWLAHLGVKVRLIDKAAAAGTTSRALAVQARTLEFYQQLGLARAVVDRGQKVATLNLWVKGAKAATVPLEHRQTYMILQQTNLMADRRRRHVQFVGGERQAEMPRRGLEGPQRVQGRQ